MRFFPHHFAVVGLLALAACQRTARKAPLALAQDVYVWQRSWPAAAQAQLRALPSQIDGVRVLAAEVDKDGLHRNPLPDLRKLPAVILVTRIEGSRVGSQTDLTAIVALADRLRSQSVNVLGIEIDYDCATAALPSYATWLAGVKRSVGDRYRLSITALPTWATDPEALRSLASLADELVVQVHAVRAPQLFTAPQALCDVESFAEAIGDHRFRVALPNYQAVVKGEVLRADASSVVAFVHELDAKRIDGELDNLAGLVWFRLPIGENGNTWSRTVFSRVVESIDQRTFAPRVPAAEVVLQPQGDGRFDVVVANHGNEPATYPSLSIAGDVVAMELRAGYAQQREATESRHPSLTASNRPWLAPWLELAPAESQVIGWINGKDVAVYAH